MFKSSNYAQIICEGCKEVTHILPDDKFTEVKLNCKCKKKPTKRKPNEPKS